MDRTMCGWDNRAAVSAFAQKADADLLPEGELGGPDLMND